MAVSNVSSELLLFTISSPLLFAVASGLFVFFKNKKGKGKRLLIYAIILYTVVVILFLLVSKHIIYINFVIVVIEALLIKKLGLNDSQVSNKATILSIPLQILFFSIGFSMYQTFMTPYIYIIFVFIMSAFSLWLSLSERALLKKNFSQATSKHIVKTIISSICIIAWVVPLMYSYVLLNNSINIKLDLMIYGLLIAIYPYATMLIARGS